MNIPRIIQADIVNAANDWAKKLRADLEVFRHMQCSETWRKSVMEDTEKRIKALEALEDQCEV